MKAKQENIVNQNRNKLQEVLPLATPYTIAIDPCNLCNFKCKFCAMQVSGEKQNYIKQMMSLDMFRKIIDDLIDFPDKIKVLRINGQGEPLMNPYFPDMIAYAKEKNIAESIETITNGSFLEPDFNSRLIASGIDRIRISVEAINADGYYEMTGKHIDFDKFVENIKDLFIKRGNCEIYIKIVDAAVPTDKQKENFYEVFGDICDKIFIDNVIPLWSDFDELTKEFNIQNQKGVHGQEVKKIKVCPFPFYSLIINPEGHVTVCCADWKRKLIIGDVSTERLQDIWNGSKLKEFWIEMLKGNKEKYPMCQKCLLPSYDCNDDIDEFADTILKKIK